MDWEGCAIMRAYPGCLRQRLFRGLQSSFSWESLKGSGSEQGSVSLRIGPCLSWRSTLVRHALDTLFGDGMAVGEIFDPRFLSSD